MASPDRASARYGVSTPPRSALAEVPPDSQSPRRCIFGSKASHAVPSPAEARQHAPTNAVALFHTAEESADGKSPQQQDGSRKRGLDCQSSSAAPASSKSARTSYQSTPALTAVKPPPPVLEYGYGPPPPPRYRYGPPPPPRYSYGPPPPPRYRYGPPQSPPHGGHLHHPPTPYASVPPPQPRGSYGPPPPPPHDGYWPPPPPRGSYGPPPPGTYGPQPPPPHDGHWRPPPPPGSYGPPPPGTYGSHGCYGFCSECDKPLNRYSSAIERVDGCRYCRKCRWKIERPLMELAHDVVINEDDYDIKSLELKHLFSPVPLRKRKMFKVAQGHTSVFHVTCLPLEHFQVFDLAAVLDDDAGREWYDGLPPERQDRLAELDGEICLMSERLVNMHGHDYDTHPIPHLQRQPRLSDPVYEQCFVSTDPLTCQENHRGKDDRTDDYGSTAPLPEFRDKAHMLVFDSADAVASFFNQVGLHGTIPGTPGQDHLGASEIPIPVKAAFEIEWNGPTIHTATYRLYFVNPHFLP